ncbi:class I SAM-dependent methyltransferase [Methylobacterium gnaphalii]|uniref:Uncharacterized protein n=1 Tax=Methylobacterium gnaphalii TaxID=1010610 RepID=A0A512JJ16_9HYPH|nr:class I SAM-dependent methyltransferase [Methylobacterium gnaphalii]GEP09955.1 hypothetical protein MGN01_18000 [Methylobacterium gnaphalii]GJD68270.1 hypothetical protein MMMDOFMJ_1189 [Methylobacterium gnaphalii]GLS51681.1 hypothetical protein GCM10007885_45400 [Methylobacterium gnaphalii]
MLNAYVLGRAFSDGKYRKIFRERLSEPLHLNLLSLGVALFGSYRTKVEFDLMVRQQYAFPVLFAADAAKKLGLSKIVVLEFGVATGAGLMNLCQLAERTERETGVTIEVVGFDTGTGMPPALDYRDLPEYFQEGDFPMDFEALRQALPPRARLVIGPVEETIPDFLATVMEDAPIGFISIDVDYYSSAVHTLPILTGRPEQYLPITPVYLDDVAMDGANPWNGELLAVAEFNVAQPLRKVAPFTLLRSKRIFKNAGWIDRMYAAHIHNHPTRTPATAKRAEKALIRNEYLRYKAPIQPQPGSNRAGA